MDASDSEITYLLGYQPYITSNPINPQSPLYYEIKKERQKITNYSNEIKFYLSHRIL